MPADQGMCSETGGTTFLSRHFDAFCSFSDGSLQFVAWFSRSLDSQRKTQSNLFSLSQVKVAASSTAVALEPAINEVTWVESDGNRCRGCIILLQPECLGYTCSLPLYPLQTACERPSNLADSEAAFLLQFFVCAFAFLFSSR